MSAPEHPNLRTLGQGAIPQHLFRALRSPPVSARHCLSVGPPPKCGVRVAQLCLTLCDPWTIQSVEFSRPEYWSGEPFPSPGDLPNPEIEPGSPALQADSFPAEPQGKPLRGYLEKLKMAVSLDCSQRKEHILRGATEIYTLSLHDALPISLLVIMVPFLYFETNILFLLF